MNQNRRGFSLIEVGLGVMIVIFVFGFLLPSLPMARERGRRTQCLSNLKLTGLAMNLYHSDNKGKYPTNVIDLVKYSEDENVCFYMCPCRTRFLEGKAPKRITELRASPQYAGYHYLSATSMVPGMAVGETILPVMCDKAGNHGTDGINILFADGHAAWWAGTIEDYARSNSLTVTINTNWVN